MKISNNIDSQNLLIALGLNIKKARIAKGMNQSQLAKICGLYKSNLSKIESGQVNISYIIFHKLSQCLNIKMSELAT